MDTDVSTPEGRAAEVLAEHRADDVARDCLPADDGRMAWVYARRCDCGWHGPSDQHDAHLAHALAAANLLAPVVEAGQEREALAKWLVSDRLALYGYPPNLIEEAMRPIDHRASGCEIEGYEWLCEDENDVPRHPLQDKGDETAEFVCWVLDHPALAAERERADEQREDYRRQVSDAYDEVDRTRAKNRLLADEAENHRAKCKSLIEEARRQSQRADRAEAALVELRGHVERFINQRPEFITALKNTPGDSDQTDYDRWQGHAESRRHLCTTLGVKVPHHPGDFAALADPTGQTAGEARVETDLSRDQMRAVQRLADVRCEAAHPARWRTVTEQRTSCLDCKEAAVREVRAGRVSVPTGPTEGGEG